MDKPTLSSVLDRPGDQLTVSAQVYYDSEKVFINGYRPDGEKWIRFGYDERIELSLPSLDKVFRRHGWTLAQPPVSQAGLVKNYILKRADGERRFSASQISVQAAERIEQDERMAQFAAWDEYRMEVLGANS